MSRNALRLYATIFWTARNNTNPLVVTRMLYFYKLVFTFFVQMIVDMIVLDYGWIC